MPSCSCNIKASCRQWSSDFIDDLKRCRVVWNSDSYSAVESYQIVGKERRLVYYHGDWSGCQLAQQPKCGLRKLTDSSGHLQRAASDMHYVGSSATLSGKYLLNCGYRRSQGGKHIPGLRGQDRHSASL